MNSGGIVPLDGHTVHVNYMIYKVIIAFYQVQWKKYAAIAYSTTTHEHR